MRKGWHRREKLLGHETDSVYAPARRIYSWARGVVAGFKRQFNRRVRRKGRQALRVETEAERNSRLYGESEASRLMHAALRCQESAIEQLYPKKEPPKPDA